ncbi:phosphoribosylaminoimidazolesuccinocarboxamide synthase [bacterium]|nr:phosphoribosylaminoimidazolesuccinocarboxamide synthase [bacterium]
MAESTLLQSSLPGIAPAHTGKVRDMYDLDTEFLMVTTDRLSAFDVVFPSPIPGKGRVLTALSVHWFQTLGDIVPNHLIEPATREFLDALTPDADALLGRSLRVEKCEPIKAECIVRGSLEGSGWKEYRQRGAIQEHGLPPGLKLHDQLPEPIFTPSTKADAGHDENVTFAQMADIVGRELAETLRETSIRLFTAARDRLKGVGITLADTKFEFGLLDGEVLLIDEALTPDSSRFLIPGEDGNPVSMDKQFVRDWAERTDWNKKPPAPELPADVIAQTSARYREIAERIIGKELPV